jgi:hypothetical protein
MLVAAVQLCHSMCSTSALDHLYLASAQTLTSWLRATVLYRMLLFACRYAMLSLGNIYFSNLEDKGRYDKHLQHAANFYVQVSTVHALHIVFSRIT